jgi:hypothetical protein
MTRKAVRSGRSPLVRVAPALVAAACVSACGSSSPTLNSAGIERAVANSILKERGVYAKVACPSKIPLEAGHVFVCQAHLDVGTYPVTVTETNAAGHVRYENRTPLVVLNTAKVERAIRASIFSERHLHSSVLCPAEVLQQAGVVFTCQATVDGKSYPFTVSEVDGKGHVRYVAH